MSDRHYYRQKFGATTKDQYVRKSANSKLPVLANHDRKSFRLARDPVHRVSSCKNESLGDLD